jgi:P22 coat protein - gene protein 5
MAVPNNLAALITPLLALGMQTMRSRAVLPRLVNRGYDPAPGAKGTTVTITIPSAVTATDVVPGHTAPDTGPIVPTSKSFVVDQWKEAAFTLTDKDLMAVTMGIIPMQAAEAIKALVDAIETHLWSKVILTPYMNGTAGTTPFAVNTTTGLSDMSVYINARKNMNARDVPDDPRFAVINPDAAGNLLQGRQFTDASWRGDTGGIINGAIGTKLGANWVESNKVPTNTSTALTAGALTVNGVNAAGSATVSLAKATNPAPLYAGNTITIATGAAAGSYRVTADTTLIVGNTAVPITPVLRGATAGGEAVTLLATAVQNMLFHRDAFAFVTRPLAESTPPGADGLAAFDTIIDPVSGLVLRLELTREYKQWRWSYDVLWGASLVRDDFVQVMLG